MLPLVGDLAPPERRASALSVVVSGMLLGMMLARLLSGVVAYIIGWRYIYWISFALQYIILILLYLWMPDYPSTNPGESLVRRYPYLLRDILKMPLKYPVLMQGCLIGFFTSSTFTNYWTTLTFLLADRYHYSSLVIGLFAVIGIAAMTWGPIYARKVMDKTVPLFSVIVGGCICLISVIIGTYTGRVTVAGPIIQAMGLDIGIQTSQIANRTAIYSTAPKARNRVNTSYMVCVFCGQLMGTAVGNRLYAEGGWIASGSASVGFISMALIISLARGPYEPGWVGWSGGWSIRKRVVQTKPSADEEGRTVDAGERDQEPSESDSHNQDQRLAVAAEKGAEAVAR
jgi:predicted MFS family arabinose efflux permease